MSQTTRAKESRQAEFRPPIGGEARGQLDIDLSGLPDDLEATFIREYTLGERDLSNVQRAMQQDGYEPATVEMFPNANPRVLPGDKDTSHGLIRRGGQILMVRDKRIGVAERKRQKQEVLDQKKAVTRLSEAQEGRFDGTNFREAGDNGVSERSSAGEAVRPAQRGGEAASRFQDA